MTGVWCQAPDRLKWAAMMPLSNPPAAVGELRRVNELGAAGVVIFGTAAPTLLQEPELDLWLACVHAFSPAPRPAAWRS